MQLVTWRADPCTRCAIRRRVEDQTFALALAAHSSGFTPEQAQDIARNTAQAIVMSPELSAMTVIVRVVGHRVEESLRAVIARECTAGTATEHHPVKAGNGCPGCDAINTDQWSAAEELAMRMVAGWYVPIAWPEYKGLPTAVR